MEEHKEYTNKSVPKKSLKPWQNIIIGFLFWLLAKIISDDYLMFAAGFEIVGWLLFLSGMITLVKNKLRKKES